MFTTFEELHEASQTFLTKMAEQRNGGAFESEFFEIVFVLEKGRKYHRIVSDTRNKQTGQMFGQRTAAAFVDASGNVYKADGWKRPAKQVRGHITNEKALDGRGFIVYR